MNLDYTLKMQQQQHESSQQSPQSPLTQRLPGSRLPFISNSRLSSSRRLGTMVRDADLLVVVDTLDNAKLSRHSRRRQSSLQLHIEKSYCPLAAGGGSSKHLCDSASSLSSLSKPLQDLKKQQRLRRKSFDSQKLLSLTKSTDSSTDAAAEPALSKQPSPKTTSRTVDELKKQRLRRKSLSLSNSSLLSNRSIMDLKTHLSCSSSSCSIQSLPPPDVDLKSVDSEQTAPISNPATTTPTKTPPRRSRRKSVAEIPCNNKSTADCQQQQQQQQVVSSLLKPIREDSDAKQPVTTTTRTTATTTIVPASPLSPSKTPTAADGRLRRKTVAAMPMSSMMMMASSSNSSIVADQAFSKPVEDVKKEIFSKWKKVNGKWASAPPSPKKEQEESTVPPVPQSPTTTITQTTTEHCPAVDDAYNTVAAIHMQRLVRGGLQRLKYRIASLQQELSTQDDKTAAALQKISERLQRRKDRFLKRTRATIKLQDEKIALQAKAAREAHQIIVFLRQQNASLRVKNQQVLDTITNMKSQNERLEQLNEQAAIDFKLLQDQIEEYQDTHEQLLRIVPQYQESVQQLQEALDFRQEYASAERKIKITYCKCLGMVVDKIEERCDDDNLLDDVINSFLKLPV